MTRLRRALANHRATTTLWLAFLDARRPDIRDLGVVAPERRWGG